MQKKKTKVLVVLPYDTASHLYNLIRDAQMMTWSTDRVKAFQYLAHKLSDADKRAKMLNK